jgi:signal transduction histidine kinase
LRLPPFGPHTREFAVLPLGSADGVARALLVETSQSTPLASSPHQAHILDQISPLGGGFMYVYDLDLRRTVYANEQLLTLMRLPPGGSISLEELLGRIHADDLGRFAEHVAAFDMLGDHDITRLEFQIKNADGIWRWVDNHVRVCRRRRNGKVQRVVGLAADITERRHMAQILANTVSTLARAEETERRRIARELHDSTAQHLVAIDLGIASIARRLLREADAAAQTLMDDLRASLAAAHREIRTFSYLLHPPQLDRHGLAATMRQFVQGFEARTGLAMSFSAEGDLSDIRNEHQLAIFRILQESLMNVHRHADAKFVSVTLHRDDATLTLDVQDDGHGLVPGKQGDSAGVGIMGMRARAETLGGRLSLLSSANGFRVRATIPLRRGVLPG